MAEPSEYYTHPILGTLGWLPEFGHWFTQLRLPSDEWLDVIVDHSDSERFEFLPRAAELFRWAFENEQRMLGDSIRAELLEMYNDTWRQGDEPALSEDELTMRLEWTLLTVSASEIVPVEFGYHAGELFGGHSVAVEVDAELRYRDVDLRG